MALFGRKKKQERLDGEVRSDGWVSALTGYGMRQHDKRLSASFEIEPVTWDDAMALWRGNDLAARMIETWPNEMLRQGFHLVLEEGLKKKAMKRWRDLGATQAFWKAMAYRRAYGGGVIIIGARDGATDLTLPLDEERVQSIDWLNVLEAREVQPVFYYSDPMAPHFGQPEIFRVTPMSPGANKDGEYASTHLDIHESRLIVFQGIEVSRTQINMNGGWGDGILTRAYPVIRDFGLGWSSAALLLQDFSQAVFKIKGLAEAIALGNDKLIQNRIAAMELSRSTVRAILMDSDEDFERKQTPLSGLSDVLDRFSTRLAACADMPVTLLMGMSPAGLNATGESDIRLFYDRVATKQDQELHPKVKRLMGLILRTVGREPEGWDVVFNPLWQPTEKEQAETRKIQMEVDSGYIEKGVLGPEEIAVNRFGPNGYSYDTVIDFNAREELDEEVEEDEGNAGSEEE